MIRSFSVKMMIRIVTFKRKKTKLLCLINKILTLIINKKDNTHLINYLIVYKNFFINN